MDILILGGTGQLGAPIAKALIEQGHQVFVTGRQQPSGTIPHIRLIQFIPKMTEWSALPKCDILINCVGIIAENRRQTFEKIHFELVQEILNHREVLGFKYFIHVSALGADARHPAHFLSSKGRADCLIQQELNDYAIIRPSIVCTPGTSLIKNLSFLIRTCGKTLGIVPLAGNGQTKVQPILIEDLVETIVKIIDQQPQARVLELVGAQAYSITDILRLMENTLHIQTRHLPISMPILYPLAWLIEKVNPTFLSREHLLMLATDNTANSAPLETLLERPVQSAEIFLTDSRNYDLRKDSCRSFV